jgi:RNA polymerase sigma factor (sigma-70 family)
VSEHEKLELIGMVSSTVSRRLAVPHHLRQDIESICATAVLGSLNSCEAARKMPAKCYLILRAYKDALRWLKRDNRQSRHAELSAEPPAPEQVPTPDVAELLNKLTDDERHLVHLRFWQGMTLQEVADSTGTPLPTVARRIDKALSRLRGE